MLRGQKRRVGMLGYRGENKGSGLGVAGAGGPCGPRGHTVWGTGDQGRTGLDLCFSKDHSGIYDMGVPDEVGGPV